VEEEEGEREREISLEGAMMGATDTSDQRDESVWIREQTRWEREGMRRPEEGGQFLVFLRG